MKRRQSRPSMRSGFALIEILVVIGIFGVMVALLLPAVQAAREAARKASCLSHLRQIGLALHNYAAAHASFPGGSNGPGFSPHAMLLPFLEQLPLYSSINMDLPGDDPGLGGPNATAAASSLAVFLCPTDTPVAATAATCYAGSTGHGQQDSLDNGFFAGSSARCRGPADVPDGLSSTVAVAEWVASSRDALDTRGVVYQAPRLTQPGRFEEFVAACRSLSGSSEIALPGKPAAWFQDGLGRSLMNEALPPNDPSCLNGNVITYGAWTAGSRHPGGAHALFADGHARFLAETIAPATWRSIGTRNGGEIVPPDAQ